MNERIKTSEDHDFPEPSPGIDELMDYFESIEAAYSAASEASSLYDVNGITTSTTDISALGG